jgi:hypothetical protein
MQGARKVIVRSHGDKCIVQQLDYSRLMKKPAWMTVWKGRPEAPRGNARDTMLLVEYVRRGPDSRAGKKVSRTERVGFGEVEIEDSQASRLMTSGESQPLLVIKTDVWC